MKKISKPKEMQDMIVVKSNHLIEASYRLTITEQKILYLTISKIQAEDDDFKFYNFDVNEFSRLIGVDSSDHSHIKKATLRLKSRVLVIKREREELQVGWVETVRYTNGEIQIRLNAELKPYLLRLKGYFTSMKLENLMQFTSNYSTRFFELLKQYQSTGMRIDSVEDIRRKLGVKPTEYKRYNDFKRYVLLTAQDELNEKTELHFEFEEIKDNKKIVKIKFDITTKQEQQQNLLAANLDEFQAETKFVVELISLNNQFKQIPTDDQIKLLDELIQKNGLTVASGFLDKMKQINDITDPFAYLIKCLEKPQKKKSTKKVEQESNYEQRTYDDEFYKSLYDNV